MHQENAAVVQQLGAAQQHIANLDNQLQAAQQVAQQPGVAAAPVQHGFRIKPPKPPVFSGRNREPSAVNWAHQMENYLQSCDVVLETPAAVRYAAGYLADSALTWYRMHLTDVARGIIQGYAGWTAFKNALVQRFTPISPERTARQRLATLKQTSSVRGYAQEYNLCMIELPEMNDKDRLHRFMFGLKPEIRLHVELKQPASLADAIELAIQVDSLLWQVRKGPRLVGRDSYLHTHAASPAGGPSPMEIGALENRKPMLPKYSSGAAPRVLNKEHIRCFFCKQMGHFKRDCPKRKKRFGSRRPN